MVVPSRISLNKSRRKHAKFAEQEKIANEKRKNQIKNKKMISDEEHKKRVEKLKKLGLLK